MSPRSCVALAVRLADARSHVARGSTGSRGELCVWMCEAHNRVNRLLGKAEFSCELSQLDMRWCGAHDPPTPAAPIYSNPPPALPVNVTCLPVRR